MFLQHRVFPKRGANGSVSEDDSSGIDWRSELSSSPSVSLVDAAGTIGGGFASPWPDSDCVSEDLFSTADDSVDSNDGSVVGPPFGSLACADVVREGAC
jgi:hypothetical protein